MGTMPSAGHRSASWSTVALAAIAFVWAGLVIGLSFIETPLKFQAPGITRELGLGIGRLVFSALNRIEIGLSLITILVAVLWRPLALPRILLAFVLFLVLLQTAWLLPVLDARAMLLVDGGVEPPPSYHHVMFIVVEALKVVSLLLLGILTLRRLLLRGVE